MTNVLVGIVLGFLGYLAIKTAFEWIMFYTCDCESMGAFDAVYFLDDNKNYSNVVGPTFFQKFDFEGMRDYLFKKTENIHKCRSKIVKKFGLYWYKQMTPEEWEIKKHKVVTLVENVHTKQELIDFMCKQHCIREPLDNV